jgi:SOS regulatory protein LexA
MLTKRQKQVFDYITAYHKKRGYSSTLEEIRRHFKFASVSTADFHVSKLESLGYLKRKYNKPRSIEIVKKETMINIPLLGLIAAGQPIEAIQNKETIAVPQNKLPRSGEFYALRAIGNSMIDENINDGDIILVKQQSVAENGQKVVALIDNYEATLKKFYKERGFIRLQPANKTIEPIIIKKDREIVIQGIVIDVIKNEEDLKAEEISTAKEFKKNIKKEEVEKYLNKVYLGDIIDLLKKLPDKCVDMIFGDPDYNVGIKYGDKTYTKNFDEYIDWYIELAKESMRVLKNDGNLFMMNYPKQNAHLRVKYLDNIYPLVNEYVWAYNTNVGHAPKRFTTAHRTILHIRKTENNKFYKDNVAVPYKNPMDRRILENLKNGSRGRMPYDWFYFDLVKNVSKEKTYHACQIPQKLTEMLIKSCTMPNDIVLVLFGGSGSELEVCKLLKRQYISAEIDSKYHELILSRLKNGKIEEKYKLQFRKNRKEKELLSLPLFNKEV